MIDLVLEECLRLLQGFEDFQVTFRSKTSAEQEYLRKLVLLQLREIDRWLSSADGRFDPVKIKCRTFNMYCKSDILLGIERVLRND